MMAIFTMGISGFFLRREYLDFGVVLAFLVGRWQAWVVNVVTRMFFSFWIDIVTRMLGFVKY